MSFCFLSLVLIPIVFGTLHTACSDSRIRDTCRGLSIWNSCVCHLTITGANVVPSTGKVTDAFPVCLAPPEPVCPGTPPSRSPCSLDSFPSNERRF